MSQLSDLERAVALAISRQYPSASAALAEQLATAELTCRDFTGSGFFTEFNVSPTSPSAPRAIGPIGAIRSFVGPERYLMEFVLNVRNGYAEMIEGYSYSDGYGDLDLLTAEFSEPETVLDR